MSKWTTVSTPRDNVTKFGVWYSDLKVEDGIILRIKDGTIYLNSTTAFIISINDTNNMGTIIHPFRDESCGVILHEDSLWTFDIKRGPSYVYNEDILKKLPNWVNVGGNWDWIDK